MRSVLESAKSLGSVSRTGMQTRAPQEGELLILEQKQSKRFYKLFDFVIVYTAQRLDIMGTLFDGRGKMNEREVYRVAEMIWGENGDRSFIRDMVDENPWRLNRSDLQEVESWKDALCARFPVVRIGRDVLFLYGGHAFAVRGLSREIDDVTGPLPTFAQTIIMPFDGLITYCTAITSYQIDVGSSMQLSLTEEAAEYCATGKLVRSAKDFVRVMPEAHKTELEWEAKNFAHKTELEMNADELGEGQHMGVLAGLSWEEREEAVQSHMQGSAPATKELLVKHFDEWCERDKQATTLAEAFAPLTRKELVQFAKAYGVRGGLSKLNKAQLVDAIVYTIKNDGPLFVELARVYGLSTLKALQRCCMSGGQIDYDERGLSRFDDIPVPCFPALLLYHDHDKGVYTLQSPREVREALEDCDWDAEAALAKKTADVIRRIELLVDYRGVVRFEDAVNELLDEDALEEMNPFAMLVIIQKQSLWQMCDFDIAEIDKDIFFLHPYISEDAGLQSDGQLEDQECVLNILGQQVGKPARRIEDIKDELDVEEWMFSKESTRDLIAYLDAHVPDGRDDYFFAEDFVESVIGEARDFCDIGFLMDRFREDGFVPTEAQLNRLLELILAMVNDVPKWTNNGWSSAELPRNV